MRFIRPVVKAVLVVAGLILAAVGVAYAFSPHPPATPKQVKGLAQMESYLDKLVASGSPPGISIAVVKDGQMVYNRAFGMADAPQDKPATVNTVYHWWSMTKIPTAMAILQLQEHGQLQLDDPVEKHLPWFSVEYPASNSQRITLRHLLNHSSGLPDTVPAMIGWVHYEDEIHNQTELVKRHLPTFRTLQFEPGSKAVYGNLNYMVLGAVIEAVSGRSYEQYITEEILQPLHMDRSGFVYSATMAEDEAAGTLPVAHFYTPLLPFLLDANQLVRELSGGLFWMRRLYIDVTPSTGLIGPASDVARLMLAYLNGGELEGARILSPQSIELMSRSSHVLGEGPNMAAYTDGHHGLGWYIIPEEEKVVRLQHHGGGPGFATTLRLYPEKGLGIVILANSTDLDRDGLADRLAELDWTRIASTH
ncbi:MAG: beta-lactamase family protein [Caldilineaceae bacterium]|nr:beta-lactamase family protein [Caldilineaceae bacterium]